MMSIARVEICDEILRTKKENEEKVDVDTPYGYDIMPSHLFSQK